MEVIVAVSIHPLDPEVDVTTLPVDVDGFETLTLTRQALAAQRLKADQLEAAVLSNRRIGVATGIVMLMENLDADAAFEALRQTSMNFNRRLADLAEDVIYLRRRPTFTGPARRGPSHGVQPDRMDAARRKDPPGEPLPDRLVSCYTLGMPRNDPGPSVKDPELYEKLRGEGDSKQKSARIANAAANTSRTAVGRKGGKAEDYDGMTKEQLMRRARQVGISGRSSMSKPQLIDALRHH